VKEHSSTAPISQLNHVATAILLKRLKISAQTNSDELYVFDKQGNKVIL
jgi:hypothetical protein